MLEVLARTSLGSLHNLGEAQKLCDRVAILEHGKLVALGSAAELARKLGRGRRLELQVAPGDEEAALRLLAKAPGISAHRENGTIVAAGAEWAAVPGVVTSLASAGVRIFRVTPQEASLDALLYTPTTDGELLLGKLLSAWLPALGIAWGGFLLYTVTANIAAWPVMGRLWFPTTVWVILAEWVAPAVAGLGVVAMVLISSRARTFQAAYRRGGLVILPILLLFILPAAGVMAFSAWVLVLLGLVIWAVDAALLRLGRRSVRRTKLAIEM